MNEQALIFEHLLSNAFGDGFYNWPAGLFRSYVTENKQPKDYEAMGQVNGMMKAALQVLRQKQPLHSSIIAKLYDDIISCSIDEEEVMIDNTLLALKENETRWLN